MMISEKVERAPIDGRVAVLEDEEFMARAIAEGLQAHAGATCELMGNMSEFTRAMKGPRFDVVSIDWELHSAYRGREALAIARREQPEAARIVYTKHRAEVPRAIPCGADAALVKPAGIDLDKYNALVKRGIRLGMARRIVTELKRNDGHSLPELRPGRMVNRKIECIICETSLSVARRMRLRHQDGKDLVELLVRRNWWEIFSEKAYIEMPWSGKLSYLLRAISVSESDTAHILGIDVESVGPLLEKGQVVDGAPGETEIRVKQLLSVLGCVLRLAEYEPELMVEFWKPSSGDPPRFGESPWGDKGLGPYLIKNGPLALQMCLRWMRRD